MIGITKNASFSRDATYQRFGPESWNNLDINKVKGVPHALPESPGVYEVWVGGVEVDDARCLYIGSGKNLFTRVRNGLFRGTQPHSHRDDIINYVGGSHNVHLLSIMWSKCERYQLVEAYLHELYQPMFPDKDLIKGWGLDLSYQGKAWQYIVPWLRGKGMTV